MPLRKDVPPPPTPVAPPPPDPGPCEYVVVGPFEVFGVPTGGTVNLSEMNSGARSALIAAGHVVIADPESPDVEEAEDDSPIDEDGE